MPKRIIVSMITPDMIPDRSLPGTKLALKTITGDEVDKTIAKAFVGRIGFGYFADFRYVYDFVGTDYFGINEVEISTTSTTLTKVKEFAWSEQSVSTITTRFNLHTTSTGTATGQIYKNGSAIGTLRSTTDAAYVTYDEALGPWSYSDLLQLYLKTSNAAYPAYNKNFGFLCTVKKYI